MCSSAHPLLILCAAIALVAPMHAHGADGEPHPPQPGNNVFDHRYNHDRYYPPRGQAVRSLPLDARASRWRGSRYYFHGGVWYRPARSGWVVVTPPVGLVVAALPPFYTTIWIGGVPFYYANDIYYAWRPALRSYVVVERPLPDVDVTQAAADRLYVYPKNGQTAEQQATDRYECHRWAVNETGFDPTQPAGGVVAERSAAKRDAYARALTACLQGRGYSVK